MESSIFLIILFSKFQHERSIYERSFGYQVIGNATYSVDTFFFLSGLLVALLFLRSKSAKMSLTYTKFSKFLKHGLSDSILMFFYRFMRLTPVYWFIIHSNEVILR